MFAEKPTKFIEVGVSLGWPKVSHTFHDKIFKSGHESINALTPMVVFCVTSLIATLNGSTIGSSFSHSITTTGEPYTGPHTKGKTLLWKTYGPRYAR